MSSIIPGPLNFRTRPRSKKCASTGPVPAARCYVTSRSTLRARRSNVLLRLTGMRLHQDRAHQRIQPGVVGCYGGFPVVSLPQLFGQCGPDFGQPPFHAAINSHLSADQSAGAGSNLGIQGPGIATGYLDSSHFGRTTGGQVLTPQSCKLHRGASVSRCGVRTGALLTTAPGSAPEGCQAAFAPSGDIRRPSATIAACRPHNPGYSPRPS